MHKMRKPTDETCFFNSSLVRQAPRGQLTVLSRARAEFDDWEQGDTTRSILQYSAAIAGGFAIDGSSDGVEGACRRVKDALDALEGHAWSKLRWACS